MAHPKIRDLHWYPNASDVPLPQLRGPSYGRVIRQRSTVGRVGQVPVRPSFLLKRVCLLPSFLPSFLPSLLAHVLLLPFFPERALRGGFPFTYASLPPAHVRYEVGQHTVRHQALVDVLCDGSLPGPHTHRVVTILCCEQGRLRRRKAAHHHEHARHVLFGMRLETPPQELHGKGAPFFCNAASGRSWRTRELDYEQMTQLLVLAALCDLAAVAAPVDLHPAVELGNAPPC